MIGEVDTGGAAAEAEKLILICEVKTADKQQGERDRQERAQQRFLEVNLVRLAVQHQQVDGQQRQDDSARKIPQAIRWCNSMGSVSTSDRAARATAHSIRSAGPAQVISGRNTQKSSRLQIK